MKITLVGPDDSGFWFVENEHGMIWQLVERSEDQTAAAAMFGWTLLDYATEDDQVEAARAFLMENIGAEIEAPLHIATHFEEMETS